MDNSFASTQGPGADGPPLEMAGTVKIPADAHLLPGCVNPRMSVALLFRAEAPLGGTAEGGSASSAPAQPAASAAAARIRQMMLARQQKQQQAAGGAASSAAGPSLTKNQPVKASLWRLGEESTRVWEVSLPRPDMFTSPEGLESADVKEDCAIRGAAWSPDGRRIAVNMLLRRTWQQTAGSSAQPQASGKSLYVSVIALLDTETGVLHKCVKLSEWSGSATAALPARTEMHWVANNSLERAETAPAAKDESAEFGVGVLSILRSLTPLPPLAELTSYGLGLNEALSGGAKGGAGKLLPHQMRLRQMAMGKGVGAAASEDPPILPSIAARQWLAQADKARQVGVTALATMPVLPIDAVQWGLVESSSAQQDAGAEPSIGEGGQGDADHLLAHALLCSDGKGSLHLLAQGAARLGALDLPTQPALATLLSSDLSSLTVLAQETAGAEATLATAALPLHSRAPVSIGFTPAPLNALALSTTLHHLFSYLLDTLHLVKHVYRTAYLGQVAGEWKKQIDEVKEKYRCDFRLECIAAIAGGRLSDGIEVMIMSMINESALHAMEESTYTSLRFMRRAAATVIGPTCERILVVLKSLRTDLPGSQDGARTSETEELIQQLLRGALTIELEAEKDLLASGEFYKWWKQERDKHENPRRDDGQMHPIIHDTLSAVEYVQRGFVNPYLDALLGSKTAPNAAEELGVRAPPPSRARSLEEVLGAVEEGLARTEAFPHQDQKGEQLDIVPSRELFLGALHDPKRPARPELRGTAWALASHAAMQAAGVLERLVGRFMEPVVVRPCWQGDIGNAALAPQKQVLALSSKAAALLLESAEDGAMQISASESHADGSRTLLIHRPSNDGTGQHALTLIRLRRTSTSKDETQDVEPIVETASLVIPSHIEGQRMRVREAHLVNERGREHDRGGKTQPGQSIVLLLQSEADENASFSGRPSDVLATVPLADVVLAPVQAGADAAQEAAQAPPQRLEPVPHRLPREARPVREMALAPERHAAALVSGAEQEYRLCGFDL